MGFLERELLGGCGRFQHGQSPSRHDWDANRCRLRRDVRNDDGRCRAGDSRHVVMLREPVAVDAETLGMASVVERLAKGGGGIAALRDGCQIEN